MDSFSAAAKPDVLQMLRREFERAHDLILRLDDATYTESRNGTGSVGGHFRHDLDFADSLLKGIGTGLIDYNKRTRDTRIESDRTYAAGRCRESIEKFRDLPVSITERPIHVVSEIDDTRSFLSSVGRELEFVHSHTVHHHALIKEKLAAFGIPLDANFGVAPSTLEYWKTKAD